MPTDPRHGYTCADSPENTQFSAVLGRQWKRNGGAAKSLALDWHVCNHGTLACPVIAALGTSISGPVAATQRARS